MSDLMSTSPTATNSSVTTSGSTGILRASDTFSLTASAADDWSSSLAISAETGDFETYLGGLGAANVNALSTNGLIGVNDTWMNGTNEAVIVTVNRSGLPSSAALFLQEVKFSGYTAGDRTDFLIFRPSTNEVIESQWNASYNATDSVSGSWRLEDGDKIILATGSGNNANTYRLEELTFLVADPGAVLP